MDASKYFHVRDLYNSLIASKNVVMFHNSLRRLSIRSYFLSQQLFTSLKLTIEILQNVGVKYAQS